MNFQQAKDEFLKWIIPVLLVAIWHRGEKALDLIAEQTKQSVKVDEQVANISRRVDLHREKNEEQDRLIADNRIKIGKLEIKVFGKTLEL